MSSPMAAGTSLTHLHATCTGATCGVLILLRFRWQVFSIPPLKTQRLPSKPPGKWRYGSHSPLVPVICPVIFLSKNCDLCKVKLFFLGFYMVLLNYEPCKNRWFPPLKQPNRGGFSALGITPTMHMTIMLARHVSLSSPSRSKIAMARDKGLE